MKKTVIYIGGAALFLAVIITGCENASNINKGKETNATSMDTTKIASDNVAKEPMATSAGIAELLQGKWQHIDDKTNFLVFEGNHRKETAAGGAWDDETFILSDKCANPFDKDKETQPEKDKYIFCKESDLCWYIIDVDKETLSLSYMGRGNTLTYKRVK
jgi:hypothetical protein